MKKKSYEHHEKVGQSQIDNEKISRGSERFGIHEYPDDNHVSSQREDTSQGDDESQHSVPERVHGRELVPMGIDPRKEFLRDGIDQGIVAEGVGRSARSGEHSRIIPVTHLGMNKESI